MVWAKATRFWSPHFFATRTHKLSHQGGDANGVYCHWDVAAPRSPQLC